VDLVRDLLDKEVVDRHGREMGRVDSIVLEVRDGAPPRVTAIELGPAVLAYRIRPSFGRWMAALEHALRMDEGRPLRIAFSEILDVHDRIKVDRAFGETPAAALERRLRGLVRALMAG
jgi:sporulation protein YlmC with PRC-barrel domain